MYTESLHRAVITALVLKSCHRRLHSQIILHATTCPFYHFKGATEGKRRSDISISCFFHQSWLQPPKTILQGNYSKPSFNLGLMNRGHSQADLSLSLSPFTLNWKGHFLRVYSLTTSIQSLWYIPPFGLTVEMYPTSQEWLVLFICHQSKYNTGIHKQASLLCIQNTLGCTSVKTFHIKHDLSWGQGKIKVGQNNKQILYE